MFSLKGTDTWIPTFIVINSIHVCNWTSESNYLIRIHAYASWTLMLDFVEKEDKNLETLLT